MCRALSRVRQNHVPFTDSRHAAPRHALAGCRIPHFHNLHFCTLPVHRMGFCSLSFHRAGFCSLPVHRAGFCTLPFHRAHFYSLPVHRPSFCSLPFHRAALHRLHIHKLNSSAGLPGLDSSGWASWVGLLGLGCSAGVLRSPKILFSGSCV